MEIENSMEIEETKTKTPTIIQPSKNKENLPWVEKYRPSHLKDLISHKSIIETGKLSHKISRSITIG